ncbi:MAG: glycine betaine ABC transporter substrate-binding protein [Alphaproteobacteria bacterium]
MMWFKRRNRRDFLRATAQGISFTALAATFPKASRSALLARPIMIGGRDTLEEQLLTTLTIQLLNQAGIPTQHVPGLDTLTLRRRLEEGTIDLYWEFTWVGLSVHNGVQERLKSYETYDAVTALDSRRGIVWLDPARVNLAPTLGVRRELVEATGVTGISDLAEIVAKITLHPLTIAIADNFRADAKDGFIALQRAYGFKWPSDAVLALGNRSVYDVLRLKQADVGIVQRTKPYIITYNLVALEDEREFFLPYVLAPVMRQSLAQEQLLLIEKLNALAKLIDDRSMRQLSAAIDGKENSMNEVTENFLKTTGLIKS